jgi:GAF domain-containing protein
MTETEQAIQPTAREATYREILPQIKSLLAGETNLTANLANVSAVLREAFGFFWVGFYLVEGSELVLGPFQGPVACTRIGRGRGVCGQAWATAQTIVVPDVHAFPGHIACNAASQSEIVVPVTKDGQVCMVLDVDSDRLNDFGETDKQYLGKVADMISDAMRQQ